jgi:hypothetical protein
MLTPTTVSSEDLVVEHEILCRKTAQRYRSIEPDRLAPTVVAMPHRTG